MKNLDPDRYLYPNSPEMLDPALYSDQDSMNRDIQQSLKVNILPQQKWKAALPDGDPAGIPADVSAQVALLAGVPAAVVVLWGPWYKTVQGFYVKTRK